MSIVLINQATADFDNILRFSYVDQDELLQTYQGRTLVIRGETVEGDYDSALEAYLDAQVRFEPGTYLIQSCVPGTGAYTVTINSLALPA